MTHTMRRACTREPPEEPFESRAPTSPCAPNACAVDAFLGLLAPTLLTYTLKNTHDFHPKTTYLLTTTCLARRFTTLGTHLHRNTWQYAHTSEKSHWFWASVCALRWLGHERSICVGRDGDAHRKREFCEGQWVLCITFILNLLALTLGRIVEWFLKICPT